MAAIDFKEIPPSGGSGNSHDKFEQFARDFLLYLGYKILSGPDRGADGGRDIIVSESRTGVGGITDVKWLVSCKHNAHSGKSVSVNDELNIGDRLRRFKCQGFLGFYSTLPSSGLSANLDHESLGAEVQVYDGEKIEGQLLRSLPGYQLAMRYFPLSASKWEIENPRPAGIFAEDPVLFCDNCGKDLHAPEALGVFVTWEKRRTNLESEPQHFERAYWCCKGHCDQLLSSQFASGGLQDNWKEINDLRIPTLYIDLTMGLANALRNGATFSDSAYEKTREFMVRLFPYVSRQLSAAEDEKVTQLLSLPRHFGGLG